MSLNLPYEVQGIIMREAWGQILSLGEPLRKSCLLKSTLQSTRALLLVFNNNVGAKEAARRCRERGERQHSVLNLDLPLNTCYISSSHRLSGPYFPRLYNEGESRYSVKQWFSDSRGHQEHPEKA